VIIAVLWFQLWFWSLLLILLVILGISHPPTANDAVPLKPFRHCLGWATLMFVFIGFTPTPLNPEEYDPDQPPVWYCLETIDIPTAVVRHTTESS